MIVAVILLLAVWLFARPRETVVAGPQTGQPVQPPMQAQPPQQTQPPQVVERPQPVNIYIERSRPEQPRVIIIPRNEQPPSNQGRVQRVDLPGRFRFEGRMWQPTDRDVLTARADLQETGYEVSGRQIYVRSGAESPYDELYVETEPGSGVYVKYEPTS
ncbi:MAG: hypothetical protein ACYC2Y_06400 [Armatimonadota bacterium]